MTSRHSSEISRNTHAVPQCPATHTEFRDRATHLPYHLYPSSITIREALGGEWVCRTQSLPHVKAWHLCWFVVLPGTDPESCSTPLQPPPSLLCLLSTCVYFAVYRQCSVRVSTVYPPLGGRQDTGHQRGRLQCQSRLDFLNRILPASHCFCHVSQRSLGVLFVVSADGIKILGVDLRCLVF